MNRLFVSQKLKKVTFVAAMALLFGFLINTGHLHKIDTDLDSHDCVVCRLQHSTAASRAEPDALGTPDVLIDFLDAPQTDQVPAILVRSTQVTRGPPFSAFFVS